MAGPGARPRRDSRWEARPPQGLRLPRRRKAPPRDAADPHGHRVQHEVVHRRADGHAGGFRQARVGQARAHLPPRLSTVRRLRHPRDDAARPGDAPFGTAAARRAVVRPKLQPRGAVPRLKYLEPSASFRSRWQYQNLMFLTAGYLVERRTGRSWDDLIRERVFAPLEMTRSNTSVRDLPAADDAALGHVWRDCPAEKAAGMVGTAGAAGAAAPSSTECGLVQVPYRNIDAVAPAGSINSDVEEMLHYIQFHIDSGRYNGRAILSKENAGLMETPQMLVGDQEIWPDELGVATYGLGLSVTSYRGQKLVQHGGGIDGFISQMSWLPKERIGIMVLTNMSGTNPVPNIVTRNVIDRLLGLAPIDWVARTEKQLQDAKAKRIKQRTDHAAERQPNTSPSHPLSAYGGTYEHPAYGRLSVQADGAALSLSFDGFNVPLKHFHYDVFEIDDPMDALPLSGRVTFLMDSKGDIDRMAVPFEPSVKDIEFTRVKNP